MRFLAIDPGETAGWSVWEDSKLIEAGQTELVHFLDDVGVGAEVGDGDFLDAVKSPFFGCETFVIERFALYPWVAKTGALDFDEFRTSRGIGALEYIARQAGIKVVFQAATIKEPAMASGAGEFFLSPVYENRHANDSIMHAWYYVQAEINGVKLEIPQVGEATILEVERFTAEEKGAVA